MKYRAGQLVYVPAVIREINEERAEIEILDDDTGETINVDFHHGRYHMLKDRETRQQYYTRGLMLGMEIMQEKMEKRDEQGKV